MKDKVHFTEEGWERVHQDWAAWWEGELERALVLTHNLVLPAGEPLPLGYINTATLPLEMTADGKSTAEVD